MKTFAVKYSNKWLYFGTLEEVKRCINTFSDKESVELFINNKPIQQDFWIDSETMYLDGKVRNKLRALLHTAETLGLTFKEAKDYINSL